MSDVELAEYRVLDIDGGYEPQMRYHASVTGERVWFPLLANGYWAEPDAYSYGNVTIRSILPTREQAEAAIQRARAINELQPFPRAALAPEPPR